MFDVELDKPLAWTRVALFKSVSLDLHCASLAPLGRRLAKWMCCQFTGSKDNPRLRLALKFDHRRIDGWYIQLNAC